MPDLKSELKKLEAIKFDDDGETNDNSAPSISMREQIWNYIKANPMSSAAGIAAALNIEKVGHANSHLHALHKKAIVARGAIGNSYHYQIVGDTYPRFDLHAHGHQLGKKSKGRPKKSLNKVRAKPQQTIVQAKAVVVLEEFDVETMLNTMPIAKARALYDALKKIFGV
jgi:predicted ArsR family transcriptional regulator